jgi:putative tryptophan/tyrosine transport system substrate-binding protein
MAITIGRREFIAALGAATWPLAARAQQPAMPVIGYLSFGTPGEGVGGLAAFRKGLSEMGFVEGRNVAIEFRWAQNDGSRLPELAADLIRRRVAVIATAGGTATLAAKALTSTIPIVFGANGDPVQLGLVASLNRPGGNVTGINTLAGELGPKQLGLIHELLPRATRFAALMSTGAGSPDMIPDLRAAAAAIGREIEFFHVGTNAEIDTAFADLVEKRTDALLIQNAFLFRTRRAQILTLAARHAVPVIYGERAYVEAGGLMSYGPSASDPNRHGIYVGRILKGEQPADLPVIRATKFEFLINLQTAKTLGVEVPPVLLAIADGVIE